MTHGYDWFDDWMDIDLWDYGYDDFDIDSYIDELEGEEEFFLDEQEEYEVYLQ